MLKDNIARSSITAFVLSALSFTSHAGLIDNPNAMITAGNSSGTQAPDDVLAALRDPNTSDSAFTGVVSISTVINGSQFICSGTLISDTHVLTAGHCVDSTGLGEVIDLSAPYNDVQTIFNHDGDAATVIGAKSVMMHEDYHGFSICSDGTQGCVNDDLAIIELAEAAPEGVARYEIYDKRVHNSLNDGIGDTFTMVGYGRHGDGYYGYYDQYDAAYAPSYFEKYVGGNIVDFVDTDDEGSNAMELFYTDFDGYDAGTGQTHDPFCHDLGVCSPWLAEGFEAGLGGGDSGGASFYWHASTGTYMLAGVNTFTMDWSNILEGSFGMVSGGILLDSYTDWIYDTVHASVTEPETVSLFGLGLIGVLFSRRRRQNNKDLV